MTWFGSGWNDLLGANTQVVQSGQTIQSVIDSIADATADNSYKVMVPPGHEAESYAEQDYVTVEFCTGFSWGNMTRYANNPITSDSSSIFRCILKVDSKYHVFGEKRNAGFWEIRKRSSVNSYSLGSASAALVAKGGAGDFDEKGVADPAVIYDGYQDWKMWYDALDGNDVWASFGLATSTDGITWTKYGSNPVFSKAAPTAWDDSQLHHPVVIRPGGKYHNKYYMYYCAGNICLNYIGLATSTDGITWTRHGGNPVIAHGGVTEFDYAQIRPSKPVIVDDIWYMFYQGRNLGGAEDSIGLAISPDGEVWTKMGQVFTGVSGQWDEKVSASCPLVEDNVIKLWYVGKLSDYRTGLAIIEIGNRPYLQ